MQGLIPFFPKERSKVRPKERHYKHGCGKKTTIHLKGSVRLLILFIFGIIVAAFALYLLLRVASPVIEAYGGEQAFIIARSLALSVDALSCTEQGVVEKNLGGEWDIRLYLRKGLVCSIVPFTEDCGYYIEVSHEDNKGEARIFTKLANINEQNTEDILSGVDRVFIIKEPGKAVEISDVSPEQT